MNDRLSPGNPIRLPGLPIYYQIARLLQARVYHGIYQPGTALPSEHDLSLEFGVSRQTVRQALRELLDQGIIVTRRGQGTFVREEPRTVPPINFVGYLDDLELQASTMTMSVKRVSRVRASAQVVDELQLEQGDEVVVVERVGYNHSIPVNNAVVYLSLDMAAHIEEKDLVRGSLMTVLSEQGMAVTHAFQSFSARAAEAEVAARLQLPAGSPVIYSELTVFADSYPAFFCEISYRPDRTSFTASLGTIPNLQSGLRRLPTRVRQDGEDGMATHIDSLVDVAVNGNGSDPNAPG